MFFPTILLITFGLFQRKCFSTCELVSSTKLLNTINDDDDNNYDTNPTYHTDETKFPDNIPITLQRTNEQTINIDPNDPLSSINIDYLKNAVILQFHRNPRHSNTNGLHDWDHKRRSLDKNFMRFGRSNGGNGNTNLMRFGKRQMELFSDQDGNNGVEQAQDRFERSNSGSPRDSRGDNFMRFGRSTGSGNMMRFGRTDPNNLMRFGRSDPHLMRFGLTDPNNLMRFGRTDPHLINSERIDSNNLMRFGRSDPNLMRFGRTDPNNLMRFGRSDPNLMRFGRPDNLMRFGRSDNNFMRFGKLDQNFMRFGKRNVANLDESINKNFTSNTNPLSSDEKSKTLNDLQNLFKSNYDGLSENNDLVLSDMDFNEPNNHYE